MDVDRYVTESAAFTRDALIGRPSLLTILILLAAPPLLLVPLLASRGVYDGTVIHWALVPWHEAGVLVAAALFCGLVLAGYLVRLLEGDPAPPAFGRLSRLLLDGLKSCTIPLVWAVVPVILACTEFLLVAAGYLSGTPGRVLVLLLALLELLVVLYALQYAVIGLVRFARTGRVREAFALGSIRQTYGRIGWVNYYVGLGVLLVVPLTATPLLHLLLTIPVLGIPLALAVVPFLLVFSARFLGHFCDDDPLPAPPVSPSRTRSLQLVEYLLWSGALALLLVLCFTPLVVLTTLLGHLVP
jgi:hypothetical protein